MPLKRPGFFYSNYPGENKSYVLESQVEILPRRLAVRLRRFAYILEGPHLSAILMAYIFRLGEIYLSERRLSIFFAKLNIFFKMSFIVLEFDSRHHDV